MKKRVLFISCLIVLIGLVGIGIYFHMHRDTQKTTANDTTQTTSQESRSKDVRQAVWEQLPVKQQERIDWKAGKVSKTTLAEGSTISDGDKVVKVDTHAGKDVYLVDFPTDSMAVPNNIIVYADVESFAIVGYGLVD